MPFLDAIGNQRAKRGEILCQPGRAHQHCQFRRRLHASQSQPDTRTRIRRQRTAHNPNLERYRQLADKITVVGNRPGSQ